MSAGVVWDHTLEHTVCSSEVFVGVFLWVISRSDGGNGMFLFLYFPAYCNAPWVLFICSSSAFEIKIGLFFQHAIFSVLKEVWSYETLLKLIILQFVMYSTLR